MRCGIIEEKDAAMSVGYEHWIGAFDPDVFTCDRSVHGRDHTGSIFRACPLQPINEQDAQDRIDATGSVTCAEHRPARQNVLGVHRREREWILREHGVRGETSRESAERVKLERDLEGSPLKGWPLPPRVRNFRPALDRYVASLGGPLPYMVRLRTIEEETAAHLHSLEEVRRALAAECAGDPGAFARRWRRVAESWSFDAVNELIDRHNRWYPAEARLPMDVRTRDFALVAGRPYRRRRLDAAWILERFPPELPQTA